MRLNSEQKVDYAKKFSAQERLLRTEHPEIAVLLRQVIVLLYDAAAKAYHDQSAAVRAVSPSITVSVSVLSEPVKNANDDADDDDADDIDDSGGNIGDGVGRYDSRVDEIDEDEN